MSAKPSLVPRIAFVLACAFFAFLYGFLASHFEWWPHSFLSTALDQARQLGEDQGIGDMHHRRPARHEFAGAAAYGNGGASVAIPNDEEGHARLVTSYWEDFDWLPGLRLLDRNGEVLHSWNVDIAALWPESPYDDAEAGRYNDPHNYVHGSYLFENGDVLFNVEYLGLVRMNARGEVVWRLDRRTHHSIARDDEGNFWVCESKLISDLQEAMQRFLGLIPPFVEDRALKVSPDGEVLQEFSVLEVLFASDYKGLLWTTGLPGPKLTGDVMHMNDVEPLSAEMADEYPLFEAGDVVVSLCFLNLVLVIDPESRAIKWAQGPPILRQHDPDFIGDGWISVFSNNTDDQDGRLLGGSQVVAFRPHTGEMKTIYPLRRGKRERRFYTPVGGNAQRLDSGHWLITESTAGRPFEIDARGRTVWEWGQTPHEDGTVSEVLEGTQYPMSRATIQSWTAR